mmetsp:Transcript_38547/g.114479  ORF Transcript_38547/g.114479 Transcript_38547/m.114479 type:complete len:84 (-) Transcript_38547:1915-2166(-)
MKAAELTSKYVAHLLASQEKHQNEGDQLQGAEDSHDCDKSGIEIFPQCAVIQFIKCLEKVIKANDTHGESSNVQYNCSAKPQQ